MEIANVTRENLELSLLPALSCAKGLVVNEQLMVWFGGFEFSTEQMLPFLHQGCKAVGLSKRVGSQVTGRTWQNPSEGTYEPLYTEVVAMTHRWFSTTFESRAPTSSRLQGLPLQLREPTLEN